MSWGAKFTLREQLIRNGLWSEGAAVGKAFADIDEGELDEESTWDDEGPRGSVNAVETGRTDKSLWDKPLIQGLELSQNQAVSDLKLTRGKVTLLYGV